MRKEMIAYFDKHNKRRDKNLKYDFMPDLVEIIERPAHTGGKVIIYSIAIFLLGALLWSALAKVDVVITAQGEVQPELEIQNVTFTTEGTLKNICVKNGDYVTKGQELLSLDVTEEENKLTYLEHMVRRLQAENEVYQAFIDGKKSEEVDISEYEEDTKTYVTAIVETQKYAEMNRAYRNSQYQGDDSYDALVIQQNKAELVEKLSSNEQKIQEYHQEKLTTQEAIARKTIVAHMDGYVSNEANLSVGSYQTAGEPLMQIVPNENRMHILGYVADKDIADISIGQNVEVKVNAYPYSDYGTLIGKVTNIAASSKAMEHMGNMYEVSIALEDYSVELKSGMSVELEFKTGRRSILNYLFDPVTRKFGESMKEK